MNLILASSSPRRREILMHLQLPFVVQAADIDETPHIDEAPDVMVLRLSREKAHAIARLVTSDSVILAADTTVVLDGESIGKPRDAADADAILRRLRGRPHQVFTGIALVKRRAPRDSRPLQHPELVKDALRPAQDAGFSYKLNHVCVKDENTYWSSLCETRVHTRDYSDDEIARWIATGRLYDKAGAYAIQDPDFNPVARIEGCYLNVMGLPLCEVIRGLNALGVMIEAQEPIPHDWSNES
jgi:MAF protein